MQKHIYIIYILYSTTCSIFINIIIINVKFHFCKKLYEYFNKYNININYMVDYISILFYTLLVLLLIIYLILLLLFFFFFKYISINLI